MRYARVAVLCAIVFGLVGCTPARFGLSDTTGKSTPSTAAVAATQSVKPDPSATNKGLPLEDLADKAKNPASGDRAAILDVARRATGIASSDSFYVWQLVKQGNTAVADVQASKSGKHLLVGLAKGQGGWQVVYQVRFLDASESGLAAAVPAMTSEFVNRVDFVSPVPIDDFYVRNRDAAKAQLGGAPLYAPTRLPKGFTLIRSQGLDAGSLSAEYGFGKQRLSYAAWVSGDYGEGDQPKTTYTGLRFGGTSATMDGAFFYMGDSADRGPFLTADGGNQTVCGLGVSPGIVAAVAESMVPVVSPGKPISVTAVGKRKPTDSEIAALADGDGKVLWRGTDASGTWWVVYGFTDKLQKPYSALAVRDAQGTWRATATVQSAIEIDGTFPYSVPSEVLYAIQGIGLDIRDNR